jgi:16S rRNA (uracil1498-N3)-methyltransferase
MAMGCSPGFVRPSSDVVSAPVFFADIGIQDVDAQIVLDGDEGRHAAAVRRLRVGELVDLTNGAGTVLHTVVAEVRRAELTVVVQQRVEVPLPAPQLTVVQALARGGRDEQAVEAMTEVGVDRVVGWESARGVAHWTDRTQAKWTATARAASKQARRAWCPQISGPATTADVAALCGAADLAIVLHEQASVPLTSLAFAGAADILVVVGPEGGMDDGELAALRGAGGQVVRMGNTVLRSSTAGVAALAVICAETRWR